MADEDLASCLSHFVKIPTLNTTMFLWLIRALAYSSSAYLPIASLNIWGYCYQKRNPHSSCVDPPSKKKTTKNVIYKLFAYKSYVEKNLALNKQGLICHKTQPNQLNTPIKICLHYMHLCIHNHTHSICIIVPKHVHSWDICAYNITYLYCKSNFLKVLELVNSYVLRTWSGSHQYSQGIL